MKSVIKSNIATILSIPMVSAAYLMNRVMFFFDPSVSVLYPAYKTLLVRSAKIEEWAGVEIMWKKVG